MSKTYSRAAVRELAIRAFNNADRLIWERVKNTQNKDERLKNLDIMDALKIARNEFINVIDGDSDG